MRIIIADDEAPARRKLLRLLREHGDIVVVAEAANGSDAIDLARIHRPDLLLLDVQMPDIDGIEVALALGHGEHVPQIVFVTAFDHYAARAFDLSAVDYLCKPFDRERFDRMLERVRAARQRDVASVDPVALRARLEALRPSNTHLRRLLVPNGDRSFFVNVSEIERLESDRNNVVIHCRLGSFPMRATLESLEERLDPEQFVRVHRSHIVNIDAIREVQPWFHGDQQIVLRDGSTLLWSRRFAARRPDLLA